MNKIEDDAKPNTMIPVFFSKKKLILPNQYLIYLVWMPYLKLPCPFQVVSSTKIVQ